MRKRVHELNRIPTEFHEDGAPELPPLPDEFNREQKTGAPKEKKESSIRKVMLYLAASGLVILGVITPVVRLQTQPDANPEPTAIVEVTPTPEITPEPTPAPTPVPTPEPTPEPLTGKIHIVVYSDILDIESAMAGGEPNTIIAEETFDAESFDGYVLPELPIRKGYTALGYVLVAEKSEAYLIDLYFGKIQPHALGSVALTDTVTEQDIRLAPLNEEGVREVEVHTVWTEDNSIFVLEFYDDGLFGSYHVGFPLDSDGLVYLAAFPTPEKEGHTFVGWCDSNGTPIDAVTYFDFFEPLPGATTLEDRDWSKDAPCRVYAMWDDASGGVPLTESHPDCQAVYFFTHSVCHAAVVLTDPADTAAVHVRLWAEELNDGLIDEEWTAEEIDAGVKTYYALDVNDFFGKHMEEIEALDTFVIPTLEATVTYATQEGERSVTRKTDPSDEEYVYVMYYDDNTMPTEYAFPGCFVGWIYSASHETLAITADPNKPLDRGEICVLVSVNSETIPDALCHAEEQVETYEYDGQTYTDRTFLFIMQRPDSFPAHGTAQVTVRQSLFGYDYIWEYTYELTY